MTDVDVLVVGAGPTGLVLAATLARAGVSMRVIDRAAEPSPHSRALVVHARTLEILSEMGLGERLIARGRPTLAVRVFIDGDKAFEAAIGDVGVEDTPHPFVLFVSQVETERVLGEHVASLGVRVERPTELVALVQSETGCVATVETNGAREEIRARFVVGCDGAHSAVRKASGLSFEGDAYAQTFLLGDVAIPGRAGRAAELFVARDGFAALFPMTDGGPVGNGGDRYRVIAASPAPRERGDVPTLDELRALVERATHQTLELTDPTWLASFRLHHRGVDRYRAGRAFVAGDAAHIHSPAGGQGMNTGMQDAWNLGWRLALVSRGEASPALLDGYDAERRPVGEKLLAFTDRFFSLATHESRALHLVRKLVLPRVVPWIVSSPRRRARAFRFASQLGITYRKSASVAAEPSDRGERLPGGPGCGSRAPDALVEGVDGATTMFAALRSVARRWPAFVAVAFVDDAREAADFVRAITASTHAGVVRPLVVARRADKLDPGIVLAPGGQAHERYGATEAATYLVRPDGHVSFRARGLAAATALAHLERVLRSGRAR
jgi:2-polyprenyl-6-methoxyphenol hydroxylase-like FAD-dependent oxidoreductase